MMTPEDIQNYILSKLICQHCEVIGDGEHFSAEVVCETFEGKSLVHRHRLVYQTLGAMMGNDIHALSIMAFSPKEWRARFNLK